MLAKPEETPCYPASSAVWFLTHSHSWGKKIIVNKITETQKNKRTIILISITLQSFLQEKKKKKKTNVFIIIIKFGIGNKRSSFRLNLHSTVYHNLCNIRLSASNPTILVLGDCFCLLLYRKL